MKKQIDWFAKDPVILREWPLGTAIERIGALCEVEATAIFVRVRKLRAMGHDLSERRPASAAEPMDAAGSDEAEKEDDRFAMRPFETGPRPRECQWVIGSARKRRFCGKAPLLGKPYCKEHHDICYPPKKP
jgi:hypothetical protein